MTDLRGRIRLERGLEAHILALSGLEQSRVFYSTDTKKLFVVDDTGVPAPVSASVMVGATSGTAGTAGLVPGPAAGQQLAFLRGDGSWAAAGGTRSTASFTTASLAANAEGTGTVTVPKAYGILNLATDYPARVRLYMSAAYRTADAARPVTQDPTGDHGCILEVVTTGGVLSLQLSPVAIGFDPTDGGTTAYWAVQNLDTVSRAITTTLHVLSMEG